MFNVHAIRNVLPGFAMGLLFFGAVSLSVSAQSPSPPFTAEQQQQLDEAEKLNSKVVKLVGEGMDREAIPIAKQALAIRQKVLGGEHPATAQSLNNLVLLEMAEGKAAAAGKLVEQSRRGARRQLARVLPNLSEKEQRLFLEGNDEASFHGALSLGLVSRQVPEIATLSAGWLINGKGVGHAALLERTLLARDLSNPMLTALVQQMLETRQQLATLAMSAPQPGQEAARRAALDKLTADEDRLARQLTEASGRTIVADPWVELTRVRKGLPPDGILIDIARFRIFDFDANGKKEKRQPARYVAWIIPATDKGDVQIVDLGPADMIEGAVQAARNVIQAAAEKRGMVQQDGDLAAEKQSRESLQKVADLVWKPLAEKLGGAKQIILSPDGALWLAPWGALPVTEDKVLLEMVSLRYVISGRDVEATEGTKVSLSAPVVFADPNFDLSANESRQAIQAIFPNKRLDNQDQARGLANRNVLPRVSRLPNTAAEVKAITSNIERIAKAKAQVYTGNFALETVFKAMQRPSLLVLSSHGFFLPDQEVKHDDRRLGEPDAQAALVAVDGKRNVNPLLRCGLLLAGCNSPQSPAEDDGILTGMEVVGVDLRGTELVVLSADETGVGEIRNNEGVTGLRQAFQLAGAKSVIASLWQLPDRDSMLIMNDFFQNLADGQSKAEALRNAQLKRMKAHREKHGAAHPYFWAAWTLTGE